MAYDVELAESVRELLDDEPDLTEKSMFGGLAFLVNGNMAVAVGDGDGIMVRVGPVDYEDLLAEPDATETVMGERIMRGWIDVGPTVGSDAERLRFWVRRGRDFARRLPPKR